MSASKPYTGSFAPLIIDDSLSISQFMTKYNPDSVKLDKVVHADTITGKTITYGGLREEAAKCAWGLKQKLGLKEADTVLAMVPNSTDMVLLAHSTWWAGAIFTPLNHISTVKEIAHALTLVKPTYIAADPGFCKALDEAIRVARLRTLPTIMTVLGRTENLLKFPEDIVGKSIDETLPPYNLGRKSAKSTVALICLSSGTTGKMKGVQISHYNAIVNILQVRAAIPGWLNGFHREVFFLPYFHIYGVSVIILQGMWFGNFTCALPAYTLESFLQNMEKYKATIAHMVPPIAVSLASSDIVQNYDLSHLKCIVVSAAPLKKPLQEKMKAIFSSQTKVVQGYGLSECSPAVMFQHENDEDYTGTVGKLLPETEARLVSLETGKDVKLGEEGELWIRGPQVMIGYIGDESATRNAFEGDWLKTGDILRLNETGNFWVTDRVKEMIKYKGFQVAPSELEDLLLQHPQVADAGVCSVYDNSQATELPLAYVSLVEEYAILSQGEIQKVLDDIRKWVDGQVSGYKKLRGGVLHLQQLPKTPSGKILRRSLPAKIKEAKESRL